MDTNGIVFDIQRFSLNDGPGIRTTVFLKGCPLRCIWCHNPESRVIKPQLLYKKEKCQNCLACVKVCPTSSHIANNGIHKFFRESCNENFECVKACIYEALTISGYETSVDTVLKEVQSDYDYYRNSGGGLTISGGEPMLQPEFTKELLRLSKEKEIHTCLETCGYTTRDNFTEILSYTDLFLYDIKATDPAIHKKLTGVSNQLILENLEYLYNQGAAISIRCALIQGVNDSDEHLKGIACLSNKYPDLKGVEILPYHDMGRGKWLEAGYEYKLGELKTTDEITKSRWIEKLRKFGCKKCFL